MFEVNTPTEVSRYVRLDTQTVFVERAQMASQQRHITDVFGDFWSVAVADDVPAGTAWLKRQGTAIELKGNVGLFVPPYSILDWEFSGIDFSWRGLMIEGQPPQCAPSEACIFSMNRDGMPQSPKELLELVGRIKDPVLVGKQEKATPLAFKIKTYLDQNALETFSLQEMAQALDCAPGSMSRAFRNCFGVTPVYYRNQMRVLKASLMLLRGLKVADVGQEVGFRDLSRFNKQFKQRMQAIPRQFLHRFY